MSTIAECLKDVMLKKNEYIVWSGDPDLCLEAYEKYGGTRSHPLNRIKSVIDAARKSDLFKSDGYIRSCDSSGIREILHPCFKLK